MVSSPSNEYPPRESGHYEVGDGHRLYYERYGRPRPGGIPVLFVHGGPGAGFSDDDKAFFDPDVFDVLLFEQRGSGRSLPFASLDANTTDALVDDITCLLDHFGVERTLLFGGSWGSTLSLVYAIRHPERVSAMLLRGIFLANKKSIDHFLGGGVALWYPEVWERFVDQVPPDRRKDIAGYYLGQMQSSDEKVRERFCYEWARYELSLIKLDEAAFDLDELMQHYSYRSLAPLEAHYMAHDCFLPEDYILAHANEITHVPTSIVHGRYDVICVAADAYKLHLAMPKSTMHFVCAGHSASEEPIASKLVDELSRMATLLA